MYPAGISTILVFPLWSTLGWPLLVLLGIVFLLPGGIDGTTQMLGDRESTNRLRAVTGVLLGAGAVLTVYGGFSFLLSTVGS